MAVVVLTHKHALKDILWGAAASDGLQGYMISDVISAQGTTLLATHTPAAANVYARWLSVIWGDIHRWCVQRTNTFVMWFMHLP